MHPVGNHLLSCPPDSLPSWDIWRALFTPSLQIFYLHSYTTFQVCIIKVMLRGWGFSSALWPTRLTSSPSHNRSSYAVLEMTIVTINRDRARRLCTLCPLLPPSQTFQSILPGAYRQAYTSLEWGWVTCLKIMSFLLQKKHFSNGCICKTKSPQDKCGVASMCASSIIHGSHTLALSFVVAEQAALFLFTLL